MNFREYIEEAKKTESVDFGMIGKRLKDVELLRMLHAGLGMVTEATELFTAREKRDIINVKEEFGDFFWYLAIAYDSMEKIAKHEDIVLFDVDYVDIEKIRAIGSYIYELELCLLKHVSDYIDIIKRSIYYDKYCLEYEHLVGIIEMIYVSVICLMKVYLGVGNPEKILRDNIIKLNKRHGEKFSKDGVLNRDVDNELSHIEE